MILKDRLFCTAITSRPRIKHISLQSFSASECFSFQYFFRYSGPLNYVTDLPGRRPLRSAGTNRLAVPPVQLTTVANRAFPVVGPQTWNDLPDDVTCTEFCTPSISDSKLTSLRNPFSDYFLDWTPSNLSLVDLVLQ